MQSLHTPFIMLSRPCALASALVVVVACGTSHDEPKELDAATAEALLRRAYVVSELSDDLFIIDLDSLEEVGKIDTGIRGGGNENHMAVMSQDGQKVFVMATGKDAVVVVDAVELEVSHTIEVGLHNTHASACFDCGPDGRDELWLVNEGGEDHDTHEPVPGSVYVVDMATEEVVERIEHASFVVPHNVRFAGGRAYVPSIGGNQITVIDTDDYAVSDLLLLDGVDGAGACSGDPCGFADAQIDGNGMLFAAHIETGHVLIYDTDARERLADLPMGVEPWSIFVDTLSNDYDTALMPNWGDQSVSILDRSDLVEIARSDAGDQESYGVNFSPMAPGQAFVLNRMKEEIAVIDRETGNRMDRIDVGGTTETGSTTGDGRYLLVPVSSSDEFQVIDVESLEVVKRFENVGRYPWSVTTAGGQNYCH